MSRTNQQYLMVLIVFVLVYIAPLGLRPMVTPDEFRYAEIPRAMLATGDWVTPRLNGFLYFEKPVLGYWLNAGAIAVFGETAFSVRLPSALSAGLSAFFVAWLIGRSRGSGLLAAVILLTSIQFFGTGVFAVLDGPFSALITGTMACFFVAYTSESSPRRRNFLIASGVFCGAAFLTKGFIAIAIPVITIAAFLALERKGPRLALKLAWIPAVTAGIVSLPWGFLMYLRSPDFWPYFLWTEHIQRFLSPGGAQHPEPIWFFLPILAIGALPWSPMIPAAIRGLRDPDSNCRRLVIFSLCWCLSTLAFFSVSSGKLATYIVPAYPPLAILLALGLERYLKTEARRLWRVGAVFSAVLALVGTIFLFANRLDLYSASSQWRPWILVAGLMIWSIAAFIASIIARNRRTLVVFAISPLPFLLGLHLALPARPLGPETPGAVLARNAFRAGPGTAVISDTDTIQAACWTFKRDDILILGKTGELTFGINKCMERNRHLTPENIGEFLTARDSDRILIAVETQVFEQYRHLLPPPVFEEISNGLVIAELGPTSAVRYRPIHSHEVPDRISSLGFVSGPRPRQDLRSGKTSTSASRTLQRR